MDLGVSGDALLFECFCVDISEACQERAAAQRTSARAQASEQGGLVSHADLSHFDAAVEECSQIADEFTEIHASFGGKEAKKDLPVEDVVQLRESHDQLIGVNAFSDLAEGFLDDLVIFLGKCEIFWSGLAQYAGIVFSFHTAHRSFGALAFQFERIREWLQWADALHTADLRIAIALDDDGVAFRESERFVTDDFVGDTGNDLESIESEHLQAQSVAFFCDDVFENLIQSSCGAVADD